MEPVALGIVVVDELSGGSAVHEGVDRLHFSCMLGDTPRPPIFLRHLCIFLLIVASLRQSALAAPIPESDDHVM